ncbi:MAG: hypothetical protein ACRDYZ_12075 [Acidimicrobiales bacterium]
MALAERITKPAPAPIHGLPCSVGALLEQIDGAERDALNAILYDLGWNAVQIYDALRAEGYSVGRQSINRHRGGKCRCVA